MYVEQWENRSAFEGARPNGTLAAGLMSNSQSHHTLFWNRVLTISEALEARNASAEALREHLLALEEGFRDAFDPADDFQAYVTVALCRSIRRNLDGGPPTGV